MFLDDTIRELKKAGTLPMHGCNCENCERARRIDDEPNFDRCPKCHGFHGKDFNCEAGGINFFKDANALIKQIETDEANPKDIAGASKPQMGLIPVGAMEQIARVMELGAKKYGPYNWRTKKVKLMVYANAGLRHLFKWIGGESFDAEASALVGQPVSHLACVAACMMICLDASSTGNAIDDRTWPKDLDNAGNSVKDSR